MLLSEIIVVSVSAALAVAADDVGMVGNGEQFLRRSLAKDPLVAEKTCECKGPYTGTNFVVNDGGLDFLQLRDAVDATETSIAALETASSNHQTSIAALETVTSNYETKITSEEFADPNTNFFLKLSQDSFLNGINANMVTVDNTVTANNFQVREGNPHRFKIYIEGSKATLGYVARAGTSHFGSVAQGMTFTVGSSSDGFLWVNRSGGSSFEDIMALTREGRLTIKTSLTVDGVDILDALQQLQDAVEATETSIADLEALDHETRIADLEANTPSQVRSMILEWKVDALQHRFNLCGPYNGLQGNYYKWNNQNLWPAGERHQSPSDCKHDCEAIAAAAGYENESGVGLFTKLSFENGCYCLLPNPLGKLCLYMDSNYFYTSMPADGAGFYYILPSDFSDGCPADPGWYGSGWNGQVCP